MDGAVVCSLVRVLTPADTAQDYDLNKEYTFLFARGDGRASRTEGLTKHSVVPIISSSAINATQPQEIGAKGKPLIKAHGQNVEFIV